MDHDISTNDIWTMDKVLLKPGIVVDIMNRFGARERELLQKISDLTDELREIKRTHIKLEPQYGILQIGEPMYVKKSVEDYALAALTGLLACPDYRFDPSFVMEVGEVMVAERDKRGGGN